MAEPSAGEGSKMHSQMRHLAPFVVLMILAPLLMGSSCEDPAPPQGDGALLVATRLVLPPTPNPELGGGMNETLQGLSGIRAVVKRIDVVWRSDQNDPSTERVLTVADAPGTTVLTGPLVDLAEKQIAFLNVPAGFVYEVRFITGSITVTLRGKDYPMKLPSGGNTGLKIVPQDGKPFPIKDGERSAIAALLNPFAQMLRNKGQGFVLKPVLEAVPTTLDEISPQVSLDHMVVVGDSGLSRDDFITAIEFGFFPAQLLKSVDIFPGRNLAVIKLPAGISMETAIEDLNGAPGIVSALPDTRVGLPTVPGDVGFNAPPFANVGFDRAWDVIQGSAVRSSLTSMVGSTSPTQTSCR